METVRHQGYKFGPYRLDATDQLLYKDAEVVPLPPKVFHTLLLFVTSSGRVLAKEEMLKQLWPDTFVEEGTLTQYISLLRKALGEHGRWVENLPRRGYRFTAPVERDTQRVADEEPAANVLPAASMPNRRRTLVLGWTFVIVVVVLASFAMSRPSAQKPERIRSLAVLPFVNLSGDPNLEYISDGLTDELTSALMRLPGISVAARTSAFQFHGKNEDVRQIGRKLNVSGVLEGSVRFARNKLRVTAQLVDARTGYHVWSDTYEGDLNDLLSIQQRIGSATARKLEHDIRLSGPPGSTPSNEVYLTYLQGRYFLAKGRPETFRRAAESFQSAISRSPDYARAHAGLADTHYRWALWESLPPREAFALARQAAERAVALDETLAEAHASLANIAFQYDWDFLRAEREFRRSIELDGQRADTWHWFSHLLTAIGRHEESLAASKKAIELAPFDLPSQNHLGWCYYFSGEYDRAVEQLRRALELDPIHGQTRLLLGRALLQKGMHREALNELSRNLELSPGSPERIAALAEAYGVSGRRDEAEKLLNRLMVLGRERYVSAYSLAMVHAALGGKRNALEHLKQAAVERSSRVVEIKSEPVFEPLRRDPAFQAIVSRIGL